MSFIKYFKSFILCLMLFILSQPIFAAVVREKCGDYIFQIKMVNESDIFERQFLLYYQRQGLKKELFYKTDAGIGLRAACVQDKKKQYLMLFHEYSSGNTSPEDIYGVFDPNTKKMLLKPSDWPKGNYQEVQKLIGDSASFLINEERGYFCCYRRHA